MINLIKKGANRYKANLHCHSNISDGALTPEQLKEAYKSNGNSILAITDHEAPFSHNELTDDEFLMLTGYEVYIRPDPQGRYNMYKPEVHINLIARDKDNTDYVGYNESYCRYVKDPAVRAAFNKVGTTRQREYTVEYINEFLKSANECGFLCTHNHAYWSLEDYEMVSKYEGCFSMELCNYSSYVTNRLEYNAPLYDRLLREGKRIFCHSADDNHNKAPIGSKLSDSFGGYAVVMADKLEYSSVIDALEKGEFYSSMGPEILELTVEGNKVHVETSPAKQITMLFGAKRTQRAVAEDGETVTSADFEIDERAPFIRISVYDHEGRYADTRGYFRDELESELSKVVKEDK